MLDYSLFPFNFSMLLREVESRGIELNLISDTDIIEAKFNSHVEYFINYITRLTPAVYLKIFNDKYYSKAFLIDKGISVPPGLVFGPDQAEFALGFAETIGYPVVIKPVNGSQGNLVFANLTDKYEFSKAFQLISSQLKSRSILVEKYFDGDDYRFLVIADQDVAIVKRSPPKIIGDGISSIKEIIDRENDRRMNPRTTCLCKIIIDDEEGVRTLKKQGLNASTIPLPGQVVQLRNNANVSFGASCENVLDTVHPSYIELARTIHSLFPGNAFTCIDILSKDVTVPVNADNYAFCEFNSDPGFSLHELPSIGEPHLVVRSIVDLLFPETKTDKQLNSNFRTSEVLKISSLAKAKDYPEYEKNGLILVNRRSERAYQHSLDKIIASSNFHDIIVVGSLDELFTLLHNAFSKAFEKDSDIAYRLAIDLQKTLSEYAREFGIDTLEVHFQRRINNFQVWHTDGTGSEQSSRKFTVNIAETLSGQHGTLVIHNNDLRREEYLKLVGLMDHADEQHDEQDFINLSTRKDILCNSHRIIEVPVGQLFLFTTGREYGLVHKPSTTSQWRLFMKAREVTSRMSTYLQGLNCPYEAIEAPGFLIKNESGWLLRDRLCILNKL
jgi:D-alanine-D-alanine ligase-like ATP-grasp enzyme